MIIPRHNHFAKNSAGAQKLSNHGDKNDNQGKAGSHSDSVSEGKEKKLDVKGVFVEIGHIRNTDFVKGLIKLNKKNEIVVDKTGAASVPGIFAAGDITDLPGKQTVIACGDGSRAMLSAFAYLSKKNK